MERIIKRLKSSAAKIGYLMAVMVGVIALPFAFVDLRWCLAGLTIALILATCSTAVALVRIHRNVFATAKRLKQITTDLKIEQQMPRSLDTPDELILRELHLRTLEEVRMLHAELINYLDSSKEH